MTANGPGSNQTQPMIMPPPWFTEERRIQCRVWLLNIMLIMCTQKEFTNLQTPLYVKSKQPGCTQHHQYFGAHRWCMLTCTKNTEDTWCIYKDDLEHLALCVCGVLSARTHSVFMALSTISSLCEMLSLSPDSHNRNTDSSKEFWEYKLFPSAERGA